MKARILCHDDILAATAQNVENSERPKHLEEPTTRCAVPLGVAVTYMMWKEGKERTDHSLQSWAHSCAIPRAPSLSLEPT